MKYPSVPVFNITETFSGILKDGWDRISRHGGFLALVWGIFNIPTNLFLYYRIEPYLEKIDPNAGGDGVFFMMLLLNILGYIPMIAIAVMIRKETEESENPMDYNEILWLSVRKIPLYLTTSLSMLIRMFLPAVLLMLPISLLSIPLSSGGISDQTLMFLFIGYFTVVLVYLTLRYYSAGMFYLMLDISNFRAVLCSASLFKNNKKVIFQVMGVTFVLPMLLNYAAVFVLVDSFKYMLVSLVLSAVLFLGTGLYANLFRFIEIGEEENFLSNNIQKGLDK